MVSAALVKELRERTGAGMMDCKRALEATGGNVEEAVIKLREQGLAAAEKKSGRVAAEGAVESYIHAGGKIGVLMEVNCETDFVARTDDFRQLCRSLAMQVAASRPDYVEREDVPPAMVEREKDIFRVQALNEGKPAAIVDKMVGGRLEKFYKEVCLLEQPYIRDSDKTVADVVKEAVSRLGENIVVRRFVRFQLGEGLPARESNLADEVRALRENV